MSNGGPAYPGHWVDFQTGTGDQVVLEQWEGMSLRDYFAAHASEDDIAEYRPQTMSACEEFEYEHGFWPSREWAKYQYATAMLRARGGGRDD